MNSIVTLTPLFVFSTFTCSLDYPLSTAYLTKSVNTPNLLDKDSLLKREFVSNIKISPVQPFNSNS